MTTVVMSGLAILAVAGLLCVLRLLRPGSVADRIVALDTLLVVIVTAVGLAVLLTGSGAFLDLLVVTSLVGFIGSVTVARFIERRGV
jgi:multicomponent Na+:H+ antiporter subunit F